MLHEKLMQNRAEVHIIPLEKKILFTLWVLAKQECFLAVGDRFDMAKSTAHKVFFQIIALITNVCQDVIQWPNENQRLELSRHFENRSGELIMSTL